MLASKVEKHEQGFENSLKDTNGTKYTISSRDIGGTTVREVDPLGVDDYYYEGEYKKQGIVIHFTAGYLRGDLAAMVRQGKHVCVPFLSARSGDTFQIFDPKHCWGYHLGRGAIGGNTKLSKSTIAIEVSNIGPLELKGTNLHTAYGDKYCSLAESKYYIKLEKAWRGYQYFAAFTDKQIDSLVSLVDHLCDRFDIPRNFLPEEKRYRVFGSSAEAQKFKGISTHINYRKSGKWDLGPAFPWDKLVEGIQGPKLRHPEGIEATEENTEGILIDDKGDDPRETVLPNFDIPDISGSSYPIAKNTPKGDTNSGGILGMIMGLINSVMGR